jgi:S1-C subfamily serine protease
MSHFPRRFFLILVVLSLAMLACATITGLPEENTAPTLIPFSDPKTQSPPENILAVDYVNQQDQLIALYQRANPGVVAIRVLSETGDGLGSGFVIDDQGHIVTNYHVVLGAEELEVAFPNGYKTRGEILGTDSDSDIAVIKVDAPEDVLFPIPLGNSADIQVGQMVIAIGNPLGLDGTMTVGFVSSIGRTMESLHEAPGGGLFTSGEIIQTDAAINPGNSGGPLLNLNGEVIGVNFAIDTTSFDLTGQPVNSGIGFAISIDIVKRVIPALISEGHYDYPYLGIRSLDEINLSQQEVLGLPQTSGVYLLEVTPGSPADEAGLRAGTEPTDDPILFAGGDLIIAIDGREVRDFGDLIGYLLTYKSPGDVVMLTILRGNEQLDLELTLGKRP